MSFPLHKVNLKIQDKQNWYLWSDNTDEKTLTCLPYAHRDWEGEFIYDLKDFSYDEISSVEGYSETIFNK